MKTHKSFSAFIMLCLALYSTNVFSQSWDKVKPNILYATDKKGDTTDVKVGIRTKNPQHSLDVRGKIFSDSLHVLKQIKVGNSIYISGGWAGTAPTIFSDAGALLIQSDPLSLNFNTILNANGNTGRVGIGTTTPLLLSKLDVNGNINMSNPTNGYFINGYEVLKYHGASGTANISNIFVGVEAGNSNTAGAANTANGYQALYNNITGGNNTANGYQALYNNTVGWSNTAVGFQAYQGAASASGGGNVAIGMQSLFKNNTGNYNIANGVRALYNNTNGYSNTANGMRALAYNTTGAGNTANGVSSAFIGAGAGNNIV